MAADDETWSVVMVVVGSVAFPVGLDGDRPHPTASPANTKNKARFFNGTTPVWSVRNGIRFLNVREILQIERHFPSRSILFVNEFVGFGAISGLQLSRIPRQWFSYAVRYVTKQHGFRKGTRVIEVAGCR